MAVAADLKHSVLDSEHRDLGAKLVDFGGWEMPIAYSAGTISEHMSCRTDSVAFDVSHLGTVRMRGAESFDLLQRTLTNDLTKIGPGRAQYTHLLSEDGSVKDDIIVWWIDEDNYDVMPNASNTSRVTDVIGGTDVTAERAIIAVQGPQARTKLATVFPEAAAVPRFRIQRLDWKGTPVTVAGTGYTGEDGVELSVPAEAAVDVWRAVLGAGIQPAGLGARDTLRLEAGLPLHGHELGPGITPLQAGLSWVVAFGKGEFIGRKALILEQSAGLSRKLCGIVCEGRQPPRAESKVLAGDSQHGFTDTGGFVSSGNYSPVLGHGIAMAFLDPSVEPGVAVNVDVRGRALPGQVVKLPFVEKKK